MRKITSFFRSIFKSSTDAQYYADVVKAKASFSWKYFFAFNLLAALVTGITILVPVSLFDVPGAVLSVTQNYPSDLVITADQTGVSVNQELPYSIPLNIDSQDEELRRNAITFTSDESISGASDVKDLDSYIVVTQTSAYVQESNDGEMKLYELPTFDETMTLDRSTVDNATNSFITHPFIQQRLYLPLLAGILLLLVYPFMLLFRLMTLAVYALVTLVAVRVFMKQKNLSYGKIFQISIHSLTPVIIVAYALGIFSYLFFHGWVYFFAYLAWTLFVISKLPHAVIAAVEPEPEIVTPPAVVPKSHQKLK